MNPKIRFPVALNAIILTHSFFLSPILNGEEENYQKYAMFGKTAKRAEASDPVQTSLPSQYSE